ncbi:GNAT family N-acetyltransferase [Muricoccus aerilatus]|uniref:GNAT family N-acetyltransferase n=1 Tax=Muricoccus aerilatus TaxID=452982 RepID=UPI0006946DA2|nr:GNAT family N-acetyltransferase [Roseomonas aerilata]
MADVALRPRFAEAGDVPAIVALMEAAITELQKPFLDASQIAASRSIMGLDSQLIADRTYFVVEQDDALVGCGGWSRRATMYGGDGSSGRDAALLDPAQDAARIRAMYTHPAFARRGVGRCILRMCEAAAGAEGFSRAELVATQAGEPLYRTCGYAAVEVILDERGGTAVPLLRMRKALSPTVRLSEIDAPSRR